MISNLSMNICKIVNRIKIIAIIPAYNEEKTIAAVINELLQYEFIDILVINDGSKDRTSSIAHELNVKVIDNVKNQGIGHTMKIGYQYAKTKEYDIAIQVDADGQHDISKISELIYMIKEKNYDMVIGSRYIAKTCYKSSLLRFLGIKYFSILIFILNRILIKDITSGYRAVNNRVINYFADHYPPYYPEVPMISNLASLNYKICEISVEMHKRQAGKSSISLINGIYYFFKITYVCIKNKLNIQN